MSNLDGERCGLPHPHDGTPHAFAYPLEGLGPVGGGERCEHCDGPHYGAECPVTYPTFPDPLAVDP